MKIRPVLALLCVAAIFSLSGCGEGSDSPEPPPLPPEPQNVAPTAEAGDRVETDEQTTVSLDGSRSSDSDGSISSYKWEQVEGPSGTLTNSESSMATFELPNIEEDTDFVIRLTVTDDDGATSSDDVTVRGIAFVDESTFEGEAQVGRDGAIVEAGNIIITVPKDTLIEPITITVSETDLPMDLPSGLDQIDDAFEIEITDDDQDMINGPFKIDVNYSHFEEIDDDRTLLAFHYEDGKYNPVRILKIDTEQNSIMFESRAFSTFVLAVFANALLADEYESEFETNTNGWRIQNEGRIYFTPQGNCLGMSAFAIWYLRTIGDGLYSRYEDDIALLIATRTQLAQSQTWAERQWRTEQVLPVLAIITTMKGYLYFLKRPLILMMRTPERTTIVARGHTSVVYGYDGTGFDFYDVNYPGEEQRIAYDEDGFGTYAGYNSFGFVATASMGRSEDFRALNDQAGRGFADSQYIEVTMPAAGERVSTRESTVSGQLAPTLANRENMQLALSVKGEQTRKVPLGENGIFHETLEVSNGPNTLVFFAGVDIHQQNDWLRNSGTLIRKFEGTVPVTRLLATLTWDQDRADVDLYITEPQGETMWYRNLITSSGLELDFDDTNGFGPEHGTLKESGTQQVGDYRVRVHYYSHRGTNSPATGQVSVLVNEGLADREFRTFPFRIQDSNSGADGPGGTGPSWKDIANINIGEGQISGIGPQHLPVIRIKLGDKRTNIPIWR